MEPYVNCLQYEYYQQTQHGLKRIRALQESPTVEGLIQVWLEKAGAN